MILWNYIREHMLCYPDQSICEHNSSMTYEEVVIYVELLAKKLTGNQSCAICCHSEMFAGIALLGCFAAGVTAVPLSMRYGALHCRKILERYTPSCVITDMNGQLEIINIEQKQEVENGHSPALIMWTSGTTGVPKGAMLNENNILTNVRDIVEYFRIDSSDSILIARPLYHCAVLTGEFLIALIKGAKIVFCSEKLNVGLLANLLTEQKITVFGGTPTLLTLLSHFIRDKKLFLKKIVVSGECMSEDTGRKLRQAFPVADIYHVYGLTEACPRVSYMPLQHFDEAPDCVGVPLSSVRLDIRDESGRSLPKGEKGVLWVKGGNVMQGYYDDLELTDKTLRDGWLCTGDIATITDKGWLKIFGRNDHLIIRAGMNIYPQEIENELQKDARTKEVLAYGYRDANDNTQIGLKMSGDYRDADEIRDLCKGVLPSYQIPTKIEIVDELPKNASGKLIRRHQYA